MERQKYSIGAFRKFVLLWPRNITNICYLLSYGSVLGAVFASMFPVRHRCLLEILILTINYQDNIERLVIDGVVDSENYFASKLVVNSPLKVHGFYPSLYSSLVQ